MNILINIWLFCPRRKAKWPFYVQTSLRLFVILNILKTEGPKHGWPASKTCKHAPLPSSLRKGRIQDKPRLCFTVIMLDKKSRCKDRH